MGLYSPFYLTDQVWEMGKESEDAVPSKWQRLSAGGAPFPHAQVLVGVAHTNSLSRMEGFWQRCVC